VSESVQAVKRFLEKTAAMGNVIGESQNMEYDVIGESQNMEYDVIGESQNMEYVQKAISEKR
jgi:hypothetical protein